MPATPTEQELLQRCLKGDAQAQYRLYEQYVTAMYNTAIRIVVLPADAEDVLQESFTKVFAQLHRFRNESTIGAWIKRIVLNTALHHLRARKRLQFAELDAGQDVADDGPNSDSAWDAATLHEAVKQLPNGCRVVFSLYVIEDMGHKDIAAALGISESTAKTQYMWAKKLLKAHLLALKNVENIE